MKADSNELLLYLHIPKTGGTSFTQMILDNCPKTVYYFQVSSSPVATAEALNTVDALCGHFPYGIHRETERPFRYITMLRDPVELTISYFYFMYHNVNHPLYYAPYLCIDEFIHNPLFDNEYVNLQTRFISGNIDTLAPDLKLAKKILARKMSLVGITEMYAESQFLLADGMGWPLQRYPTLNVTTNRLKQNQISSATLQLIREKNSIDIALYQYALEQMHKKLGHLSPAQHSALQHFKSSP
ncbi:sulfotransferase family 2 domain-containing protein [Paenibacillus sp. NEAU-GSW1]|uniref:sulfotransferase family 2 domain-containing protein n=1 Tax=Paenibacillus sp. NEAU-GSW1 TaxID=2682486 RepID=UPI0012E1DEB3|nr:sulfotransferase family 2 domain-containing protein [Paenibacillus sp. NEAU-GSW1]MUT64593.1 hypothetical protein [Paenibacillus sp. NEAU-GSW1]